MKIQRIGDFNPCRLGFYGLLLMQFVLIASLFSIPFPIRGYTGSGPGIAITSSIYSRLYVVPDQDINGSDVSVKVFNKGNVEENVTLTFNQTSNVPNWVFCVFEKTEIRLLPNQSDEILLSFHVDENAVGVIDSEIRATAQGYQFPNGTGGIITVSAAIQVSFVVQQEGFRLTIHLIDPNNQSLPGLIVKIYMGSTMYLSLITDQNGTVSSIFANGTYNIRVFVEDELVSEEMGIVLNADLNITIQVIILTIYEFYSEQYIYESRSQPVRFYLSIRNYYKIDRMVHLQIELLDPDAALIFIVSQNLTVPTTFFQILEVYPPKNLHSGICEWTRNGTYTTKATLSINGTVFSRRSTTFQMQFNIPITRTPVPDYTLALLLVLLLVVFMVITVYRKIVNRRCVDNENPNMGTEVLDS